jgi:hypothetical protein
MTLLPHKFWACEGLGLTEDLRHLAVRTLAAHPQAHKKPQAR